MKVKDIINIIEEFAPLGIQEKWDNSGLCIGSPEAEVHSVLLGLDCTREELGLDDYTVFIMGNEDPRTQYNTRADDGLYIVNCLNNVIPDSSPEGTCTMFFTMPVILPGTGVECNSKYVQKKK